MLTFVNVEEKIALLNYSIKLMFQGVLYSYRIT